MVGRPAGLLSETSNAAGLRQASKGFGYNGDAFVLTGLSRGSFPAGTDDVDGPCGSDKAMPLKAANTPTVLSRIPPAELAVESVSTPESSASSTVLNAALSLGPTLVILWWIAAGQLEMSGPEPRAWLGLTAVVAFASLIPLPGSAPSPRLVLTRMRAWGWVVLIGLLMTT